MERLHGLTKVPLQFSCFRFHTRFTHCAYYTRWLLFPLHHLFFVCILPVGSPPCRYSCPKAHLFIDCSTPRSCCTFVRRMTSFCTICNSSGVTCFFDQRTLLAYPTLQDTTGRIPICTGCEHPTNQHINYRKIYSHVLDSTLDSLIALIIIVGSTTRGLFYCSARLFFAHRLLYFTRFFVSYLVLVFGRTVHLYQ